ncbi:PTS sugar transporter subunit IIA [Enterococcus sp. 669A]|uniref:PTS sugar transporter subunit IIA n=1 Tax=Candidatus Enterococcus moelleringii TaxID=2815325 RepID=A0ABS3L9C4_9ENTE|nr:fructose PTS transporter subunit IIA [Enterococcus sp. 669A]MBO1306219.1 PTS sugar transporter subunit IIA [Enterococcus sp. 669A]
MVNEELIFVDLDLKDQEAVFNFLAQTIVEKGYATDATAVYDALKKREAEGTTGMMDGFAIPHAKSDAIQQPAIIVIKLKSAIDWDSLDGKPTQNIIAMFIPTAEGGTTHLKVLSQVARMLMQEDFKNQFAQTNSTNQLAQLIASKLEGDN